MRLFLPPQVLLWVDTNATQNFSTNVEFMDVNGLIGSMENKAVFRQLERVVHRADLLRYEVCFFFFKSSSPPKYTVLGCVQIWRSIH